jgi:hypothetical protein
VTSTDLAAESMFLFSCSCVSCSACTNLNRCTSTGRKCDGYTDTALQIQAWSSSGKSSPQHAIPMPWVLHEGARYLEFYYCCVQPVLSSNFDRNFWSRTTLQMAYTEPSVRHALIALSYLYSTEDGTIRHARLNFTSQCKSGTLLQHYNKSVRSLINRMGEVTYRPEIGLVTCLLFVCMELIRGNYHTAFTHLTSGLKMISQFQEQDRHDYRFSSPTRESFAMVTTPSSCMSTSIQEELAPLFERAIAGAMMYGVSIEDYVQVTKPPLEHYQSLRFRNIRELQLSAHGLRNQSIIHIRTMTRLQFLEPDYVFTANELQEQENMLDCQRAWREAVLSFVDSQALSESDDLIVSTMLMHWNVYNIWSSCLASTRQTAFDEHLPAFQDILHHARRLMKSMPPRLAQHTARFSFEISLIPALDFVAQRCRCPSTRREALSLLERNPPREGLWDAQQYVLLNRRLIEIEEEELDPTTGWPSDRTRLWSSIIDANIDQNGGFWAHYLRVEALHARKGLGTPKMIHEFFVMLVEPLRLAKFNKTNHLIVARLPPVRYLIRR